MSSLPIITLYIPSRVPLLRGYDRFWSTYKTMCPNTFLIKV
jgi:hypothetical protein